MKDLSDKNNVTKISVSKIRWAIKKLPIHSLKYDDDFLEKVNSRTFTDEDIYKRLINYRVIRGFKGCDPQIDYRYLTDYLYKEAYYITNNEDAIRTVNKLILLMIEQYRFAGISAATKLLWPFAPNLITIYDQLALAKLKGLGGIGLNNNYEFYNLFWNQQFKIHQTEIKKELSRVNKKVNLVDQRKIFDLYLWKT